MRYTFETSHRNNKYEIKVTLQDNTFGAPTSSTQIISALDNNPNKFGANNDIKSLLHKTLNDMRLTVNERTEAEEDINLFLNYLSLNDSEVIDGTKIMGLSKEFTLINE